MLHLYLMRHGQAISLQAWINSTRIPNAGFSAAEIKQAEQLRMRLASAANIKAGVLLFSLLRRARETAQIIATALELTNILSATTLHN